MSAARATGVAIACALFVVARQAAAACPDPDKLVVGDPCKHFGEDSGAGLFPSGWSSQRIPVAFTLGLRSLAYAPSGAAFDGNVESSPLAYHFSGNALGPSAVETYGLELGALWFPTPYTYVGPAVAFGFGYSGATPAVAGGLSLQPRGTLNASITDLGLVAGLRLPLGVFSLRADVLAGGQWISIDQYVQSGSSSLTATASSTVLLVEPRVSLDLWANPYFTVSAVAAMPNFDERALSGGLMLAGHFRAFDGKSSIF